MIPSWLESDFLRLSQLASHNKLHHGLLVQGKKGTGKKQLADALASKLLCLNSNDYACGHCKACHLLKAGTHPDKLDIVPEKDSLGVDQIRSITQFFTHASSLENNKVVVIHSAHLMTLAASNALLKTLEEPSNDGYIMLLAEPELMLSATVLSRCFKLNITVDEQQASAFLQQHGLTVEMPWIGCFLSQPLMLLDWHKSNVLEEINQLYQLSLTEFTSENIAQIVALLSKNTDYIAVFVNFLIKKLNTALLNKALDVKLFHENTQALLNFSNKIKEVKGVNLSLQVSAMLNKLTVKR